MLKSLNLRDVGPAPRLGVEFASRLNIFTGDNSLGKTFILDVAWWALTGDWAGLPAWPPPPDSAAPQTKLQPQIKFQVSRENGRPKPPIISRFHFKRQEWTRHVEDTAGLGLIIYARVDGGFSLWDPARKYAILRPPSSATIPWSGPLRSSFHFTADTLWNGLVDTGATLCNGLIRDWVAWQNQPKTTPFDILKNVARSLATSPDEPIGIGAPTRISAVDVRDVPTLTLPYGDVPVVHASAGIKRIISLAYLLTWAWDEHNRAVRMREEGRAKHILFEYDERVKSVSLRHRPWAKQGDADGWLTSDVFGLGQARSREAEAAIDVAKAFIRGEYDALPTGLKHCKDCTWPTATASMNKDRSITTTSGSLTDPSRGSKSWPRYSQRQCGGNESETTWPLITRLRQFR